jgi:hypothetical protein
MSMVMMVICVVVFNRMPFSEIIPSMNWIITADPRDCEHILSTHFDNYVKGRPLTLLWS